MNMSPLLPSPSEPPKKTKGSILPLLLCLVLVVGGITLFIYRNLWLESSSPVPAPPSPLTALEDRVDHMQASINALRESVKAATPSTPATGAQDFSEERKALEALTQKLAAVEARLVTLEASKSANNPTSPEQAILKYLLLRERVLSGKPYSIELDNLRKTASIPSDIAQTLSLHADQGLPSAQKLIQLLPQEQQPATGQPAQGWQDKVTNQIDKLITVRRHSNVQPSTDDFAEIKALLQKDDLASALTAAKNLPTDKQARLAPWIETVNQRSAILKALEACIDLIGTSGKDGN